MSEQAIGLPPMVAGFVGAKAAPRHVVEQIIEQLVESLDTADGDPDVELNGDEHDDDGDQHDRAWTEWDTRGRHKLNIGNVDRFGHFAHEDDEDDDADTGVEDDPRGFDPEEDDDRERDIAWPERIRQGLAGGYSHTDSEDDEPWRVPAFAHPDIDPECPPIANDNATGVPL